MKTKKSLLFAFFICLPLLSTSIFAQDTKAKIAYYSYDYTTTDSGNLVKTDGFISSSVDTMDELYKVRDKKNVATIFFTGEYDLTKVNIRRFARRMKSKILGGNWGVVTIIIGPFCKITDKIMLQLIKAFRTSKISVVFLSGYYDSLIAGLRGDDKILGKIVVPM